MSVILDPEGEVITETIPGAKAVAETTYAIIGSREPDEVQATIAYNCAVAISTIGGYRIHTGAAYGIDQKAMEGTRGRNLTVFLPWNSYNRDIIPHGANVVVYNPEIHGEWTQSVHAYHPTPSRLSRGAFALHARNFGIIQGTNGVIALPREDGGGGTAQGIRIARALGIPVIQINRGSTQDAPRTIAKVLQQLGLASKDLATTLLSTDTKWF